MPVWGIVPAAGAGSRIQPLAFSKELLPVGSRTEASRERPCAVSEYLVERLIAGGATRLCFIIGPGKSDILAYYGGEVDDTPICYAVQGQPAGLCDAVFRATPFVPPSDRVLIGLPDTIWFPVDGLAQLPESELGLLVFPVASPQLFDAVVFDEAGGIQTIEVKRADPRSRWIWGAMGMPARVFHDLHTLWLARERRDEYLGTLINAWLEAGGRAVAVAAGEAYVDVGTLRGYREALTLLERRMAALDVTGAR
jgi:dTDP-glucose pyrophosphorylase